MHLFRLISMMSLFSDYTGSRLNCDESNSKSALDRCDLLRPSYLA